MTDTTHLTPATPAQTAATAAQFWDACERIAGTGRASGRLGFACEDGNPEAVALVTAELAAVGLALPANIFEPAVAVRVEEYARQWSGIGWAA